MTNLPEWVKSKAKPFDNPDHGLLILEALQIAWRTLNDISDTHQCSWDECHAEYSEESAKDAIHRIEGLGKL